MDRSGLVLTREEIRDIAMAELKKELRRDNPRKSYLRQLKSVLRRCGIVVKGLPLF